MRRDFLKLIPAFVASLCGVRVNPISWLVGKTYVHRASNCGSSRRYIYRKYGVATGTKTIHEDSTPIYSSDGNRVMVRNRIFVDGVLAVDSTQPPTFPACFAETMKRIAETGTLS
jgi:hypothetical protein